MMRVDFYHLTRTPAVQLLPVLAQKLVDDGQRLLIVAPSAELRAISDALWAHNPASFLAHGIASGEEADREEPILLSPVVDPVNSARTMAIADGQWREPLPTMTRIFYLFDDQRIVDARGAWKALGAGGGKNDVTRHFWKQNQRGGWSEGP